MTTTIEQRIEALERQNRRLKLMGGPAIGLVLLLVVVVSVIGQQRWKKVDPAAWKGRVIDAEEFVLRDKKGVRRGRLGVNNIGSNSFSVLSLKDEGGISRAFMSAHKDGSALLLSDAEGHHYTRLSQSEGRIEAEKFVVRDKDGLERASLGVSYIPGTTFVALDLYSEDVKPRRSIRLSTFKDAPSITIYGSDGTTSLVDLKAWSDSPSLELSDSAGVRRVYLSTYGDRTSLSLADTNGRDLMSLSVSNDGPFLSLSPGTGEGGIGMYVSEGVPTLSLDESGLITGIRATLSTGPDGPALRLNDANGKTRLNLLVADDGPTLSLFDARGQTRTALGVSSSTSIQTGMKTKRPESSLVLINKDAKIIWQAPQD